MAQQSHGDHNCESDFSLDSSNLANSNYYNNAQNDQNANGKRPLVADRHPAAQPNVLPVPLSSLVGCSVSRDSELDTHWLRQASIDVTNQSVTAMSVGRNGDGGEPIRKETLGKSSESCPSGATGKPDVQSTDRLAFVDAPLAGFSIGENRHRDRINQPVIVDQLPARFPTSYASSIQPPPIPPRSFYSKHHQITSTTAYPLKVPGVAVRSSLTGQNFGKEASEASMTKKGGFDNVANNLKPNNFSGDLVVSTSSSMVPPHQLSCRDRASVTVKHQISLPDSCLLNCSETKGNFSEDQFPELVDLSEPPRFVHPADFAKKSNQFLTSSAALANFDVIYSSDSRLQSDIPMPVVSKNRIPEHVLIPQNLIPAPPSPPPLPVRLHLPQQNSGGPHLRHLRQLTSCGMDKSAVTRDFSTHGVLTVSPSSSVTVSSQQVPYNWSSRLPTRLQASIQPPGSTANPIPLPTNDYDPYRPVNSHRQRSHCLHHDPVFVSPSSGDGRHSAVLSRSCRHQNTHTGAEHSRRNRNSTSGVSLHNSRGTAMSNLTSSNVGNISSEVSGHHHHPVVPARPGRGQPFTPSSNLDLRGSLTDFSGVEIVALDNPRPEILRTKNEYIQLVPQSLATFRANDSASSTRSVGWSMPRNSSTSDSVMTVTSSLISGSHGHPLSSRMLPVGWDGRPVQPNIYNYQPGETNILHNSANNTQTPASDHHLSSFPSAEMHQNGCFNGLNNVRSQYFTDNRRRSTSLELPMSWGESAAHLHPNWANAVDNTIPHPLSRPACLFSSHTQSPLLDSRERMSQHNGRPIVSISSSLRSRSSSSGALECGKISSTSTINDNLPFRLPSTSSSGHRKRFVVHQRSNIENHPLELMDICDGSSDRLCRNRRHKDRNSNQHQTGNSSSSRVKSASVCHLTKVSVGGQLSIPSRPQHSIASALAGAILPATKRLKCGVSNLRKQSGASSQPYLASSKLSEVRDSPPTAARQGSSFLQLAVSPASSSGIVSSQPRSLCKPLLVSIHQPAQSGLGVLGSCRPPYRHQTSVSSLPFTSIANPPHPGGNLNRAGSADSRLPRSTFADCISNSSEDEDFDDVDNCSSSFGQPSSRSGGRLSLSTLGERVVDKKVSSAICQDCGKCQCAACARIGTGVHGMPSNPENSALWQKCLCDRCEAKLCCNAKSMDSCIDAVTCMCCIKAMLYHLTEETVSEKTELCPCCFPGSETSERTFGDGRCCPTGTHCAALALACIFCFPCFWCYLPLKAAKMCCECCYRTSQNRKDRGCRCEHQRKLSLTTNSGAASPKCSKFSGHLRCHDHESSHLAKNWTVSVDSGLADTVTPTTLNSPLNTTGTTATSTSTCSNFALPTFSTSLLTTPASISLPKDRALKRPPGLLERTPAILTPSWFGSLWRRWVGGEVESPRFGFGGDSDLPREFSNLDKLRNFEIENSLQSSEKFILEDMKGDALNFGLPKIVDVADVMEIAGKHAGGDDGRVESLYPLDAASSDSVIERRKISFVSRDPLKFRLAESMKQCEMSNS